MKTKYAVVKLRRNNLFNYEKVQNTFIPLEGELCLIDTPTSGLRVKCGDGKHPFAQLDYCDTVVYQGYYLDNEFYTTQQKTQIIEHNTNKIYVDLAKARFYIYNGGYQEITTNLPTATDVVPGVMKLYDKQGKNTGGNKWLYYQKLKLADKFMT